MGDSTLLVHPLIVMSIADHYTWSVAQHKRERVFGAVFGQTLGNRTSCIETFEISLHKRTGEVDVAQFDKDAKLFKEVHPAWDFLGLYVTGVDPSADDQKLLSMFESKIEGGRAPLLVLLDPNPKPDQVEVPMKIFQDGNPVEFRMQADEAERVALVYCLENYKQDTEGVSQAVPHLQKLKKAMAQLSERVSILQSYLKDCRAGSVPENPRLLRAIKGLCDRLPMMDSAEFKNDLFSEYNDALLMTYLATITQGCTEASKMIATFNKMHDAGAGGFGGGGMMRGRMMGF